VGLAIENMFIHAGVPACFAASCDDLVELVDTLGDSRVFGICWDTGHGHMNKLDQPAAVRKMGKRLTALHINDNRGQGGDDHLLPYHGFIAWEPFLKALGDVGYEGDFAYEIHNFSKGFDAAFHQEAVTFARKLGQHMLTLM
jgi:sugar phosphate isomerase/epimerase